MRFIDLTGQEFGRLTVVERAENKRGRTAWLCQCECGKLKTIVGAELVKGDTKSCGCIHNKCAFQSVTEKRLYKVWREMLRRCYNGNCETYKNYGGRGITVCNEWHKFKAFYNWAIENGYDKTAKRGNCTIDRKDNNKGYTPNNCRWVNNKTQSNNKRNNRLITYNDEQHTLSQWAEIKKIKRSTLSNRLIRGWTIERALNTP